MAEACNTDYFNDRECNRVLTRADHGQGLMKHFSWSLNSFFLDKIPEFLKLIHKSYGFQFINIFYFYFKAVVL